MLDILLIAVVVLPVICAANMAATRRRLLPLLLILTLGLVNIGWLWRGFASAVRRLGAGEEPAFDAEEPVHRTAALLLMLGLSVATVNIALPTEAEDMAVALDAALPELMATGALHLAAAFLGVGWMLRRRRAAVLRRLALRMPTLREAGISVAAGICLWLLTAAAVALWEAALPAEVFQLQTESARQFAAAFSGSIAAAMTLAIIPAFCEEIFYRGALQPIFGVFLSSLFFTATHQQYGLSPALLILFGLSLGFAWLRLRFDTSAAIIAHAVFNFLPFVTGT